MNRILFGGSLTLGAKGKLPLLPPPLLVAMPSIPQYIPVYHLKVILSTNWKGETVGIYSYCCACYILELALHCCYLCILCLST